MQNLIQFSYFNRIFSFFSTCTTFPFWITNVIEPYTTSDNSLDNFYISSGDNGFFNLLVSISPAILSSPSDQD